MKYAYKITRWTRRVIFLYPKGIHRPSGPRRLAK